MGPPLSIVLSKSQVLTESTFGLSALRGARVGRPAQKLCRNHYLLQRLVDSDITISG